MQEITSEVLRQKFLNFFESKGHKIIQSSSLIPENDPTVLFTTAGMHPLVPYLLGQPHPSGKRLCNAQKCVRTGDIDEVGDMSHCTFFEMLGNWSLGDYFKKDAIKWSFEFLTGKQHLNIPIEKIAVSVFAGDNDAPKDDESASIWQELGISLDKIFYLDKKHNWWGPAGTTGPCGPDTEMFIDLGGGCGKDDCSPACSCGRYIEIWNDVFMEYFKDGNGNFLPLKQKNVDTGMGLERTLVVLNNLQSVYETDLFSGALKKLEELTGKSYRQDKETTKAFRIILDHTRTATFMIGDKKGITPSNVDQGYVLRRIIRRAARYGRKVDLPDNSLKVISRCFIQKYKDIYPELFENRQKIESELETEEVRFSKTLIGGLKEFEKIITSINSQSKAIANLVEVLKKQDAFIDADGARKTFAALKNSAPFENANIAINLLIDQKIIKNSEYLMEIDPFCEKKQIDGKSAFRLYDTFGFPIEITLELALERDIQVDTKGFEVAFAEHQKKSQAGGEQRFKGGLADNKAQTARLHTATHLLLAALKLVLSDDVNQKGSNITADRLRFDFNFNRPMTEQEIERVEQMVNEIIEKDLPITMREMDMEKAIEEGAVGVFESKYSQRVNVYFVEGFSKEICGGPHAKSTGELGKFKIVKEQSSSSGVRRIRAVLE